MDTAAGVENEALTEGLTWGGRRGCPFRRTGARRLRGQERAWASVSVTVDLPALRTSI